MLPIRPEAAVLRGDAHEEPGAGRPSVLESLLTVRRDRPSTAEIARVSSMHMAQVLASVTGAVLERLPHDLRQPMFDLLCTSAFESVRHVVSSHSEETKREVSALTYVYVSVALQEVASELGLDILDPADSPAPGSWP